MDSSFTDAEKRFVLAEIIKVSHLDVDALVDFVRSYNVAPDWLSMQLPGGRNMNQVIRAAEAMFKVRLHPPPIPMPQMKRKSIGDLNDQIPKRLAMSPIEQQPPPPPPSMQTPQAQQPPPAVAFARNVNIQPRPSPNGGPPPAPLASVPALVSPAGSVRKRGRPSKADKEAQARANASMNYVPAAPLPSLAPQPSPQTTALPPPPHAAPSPPDKPVIPAAPPPPPLPPTQAPLAAPQSPYPVAFSSYGGPKTGGKGRPPASVSVSEDDGINRGGPVRWRPITSPSDFPAADKRAGRGVCNPAAPLRIPQETRSADLSERSPSVSNLISAPDPPACSSSTTRATLSAYTARQNSPAAAQAAMCAPLVFGGSNGTNGNAQPAVDLIKEERE